MKHSIGMIVVTWCLLSIMLSVAVHAADDIQVEFDAICGIMQEAEEYPVEELKALIGRVGALEEKLNASEHPKKKVMLFRLKKCKDFLQFIIDTKQ